MANDLLRIYLTDHLAGATAGLALARRAARGNARTSSGPVLAEIAREIAEDRVALERLLRSVGGRPSRVKNLLAAAGERAARLKLNGRLRQRSPLSRLVETEALTLGVTGKLALWEALLATHPDGGSGADLASLAALAERARGQRERLEAERIVAARTALATSPQASPGTP